MGDSGIWVLAYGIPGVGVAVLLGFLAQTGLLGATLVRTKSFAVLVVACSALALAGLNGSVAAEVATGVGYATLSMLFFEPGWMLADLLQAAVRRIDGRLGGSG